GDWISGQWKGMISSVKDGYVEIDYIPSGVSVSTIRLQYYVIGGSDYDLFLDEVVLIENGGHGAYASAR
ncbi:hypothetical protein KKB83_01415, partial [Patescibacteria group bacterium]|nr:hypothetical protein [Patescibacteria group bacterium]